MSDDRIRQLLSEGLDLCVRARAMDEIERDRLERQMRDPDEGRSITISLWMQEQYEKDLAKWEADAREALSAPKT